MSVFIWVENCQNVSVYMSGKLSKCQYLYEWKTVEMLVFVLVENCRDVSVCISGNCRDISIYMS